MASDCMEFNLVGVMEHTVVMQVMAKLQRDYDFVVKPSVDHISTESTGNYLAIFLCATGSRGITCFDKTMR